MKALVLVIVGAFTFNTPAPLELEAIRNSYLLAPTDKKLCKEMITELNGSRDPVCLAYRGAFKAIWAKHIFNPIGKLETFNQGKTDIEKAVSQDPDNIEIRLIRLSVQSNAPRILGYSSNIEEDKKLLMANRESLTSEPLKKIIDGLVGS